MSICVYIYTIICIYIYINCIYIVIYDYIYTRLYIWLCIYISILIYDYIYIHDYINIWLYIYIHDYINIWLYIFTIIYIWLYIYEYIYICNNQIIPKLWMWDIPQFQMSLTVMLRLIFSPQKPGLRRRRKTSWAQSHALRGESAARGGMAVEFVVKNCALFWEFAVAWGCFKIYNGVPSGKLT